MALHIFIDMEFRACRVVNHNFIIENIMYDIYHIFRF